MIERNIAMPSRIVQACLSVVITASLAGTLAGAEADRDPWAPFRFLIGEWTAEGSGQPGSGQGTFTFRPELQGKVLVRSNRAEIARGPGQFAATHEDVMVISPAANGQPAHAKYWDNEGHTISYTVQPSANGRSLVFLSEPADGAPRFRLTYAQKAPEVVNVTFEIAPPNTPESFKTYLQGTARRTPRSQVGALLPRGYVAHRTTGPIAIDGKLDEADWKAVPWTESFLDIEGDLKPVPRLETRAKMLWDDDYFYVAARLEEPHVWGTLTKHDSVIFQDNDFEIFIDPDGDNHEYYELEINALNTEWDLFLGKPYRDGGPAVNEWEVPGLKTGVHIEGTLNDPSDKDKSWSVEFAIPWKVLIEYAHRQTPPRDGDQWRINFSRVEWEHEVADGKYRKMPGRREDNWIWSPQGFVDMHRPETWGFVQFSSKPAGTAVAFRPDRPGQLIRERLIDLFNAQRRYHGKNKHWATRVEDLDMPPAPPGLPNHPVSIRLTKEGYEATFPEPGGASGAEAWTIRQDSRIQHMP